MKAAVTFLLLVAFAINDVQARVGETLEEIKARYGEGKATGKRVANVDNLKFTKNGFDVEVSIKDGKSIYEMFHRKDQVITDADIQEFLKANATPANRWRFDKKENHWERGGKPKFVAYREPGHPDFFVIKDLDACAAAEKAAKPKATGF
jgi:hypothetical protein